MNWQFLILASVFLYSVSILLQRVLLKEERSDPVAYSIFFQLLTGLLIGMFGFLFSNMSFPNIKPLLSNLVLMTLFYGFGNVFIFRSLKQIEASRFTVIFASRALFTILASSLLIREMLNLREWFGAFLIFFGVLLVTTKRLKFAFKKEELIALFAAMCFGFANTNDRILLRSFNVYPFVFLVFIVPAFFILSLNPSKIKKVEIFMESNVLAKMLLLCVVYAISAIAFFSALQAAPSSSQVVIINLTSIIVTVLLAVVFLKEQEDIPKKILGAISSFLGLILVS